MFSSETYKTFNISDTEETHISLMPIVSWWMHFFSCMELVYWYFCGFGCFLYYPVQCQYTYGTKGQFQAVFLYCHVCFYWSSISVF